MILRDRVTVTYQNGDKETLRAAVGSRSGKLADNTIPGLIYEDILRATVPPREGLKPGITVNWRGTDYDVDEVPLVRRRNGRDHHMTVSLKYRKGPI